jgi:hypothetical protein
MNDISNEELVKVIADFLEMGHVENIVAMFKQDPSLYEHTGVLISDERFAVRLGMAVLFEELALIRPDELRLAIPPLLPLLAADDPRHRGEAANLLGIIDSPEATVHLQVMREDPDPQVAEIVRDILGER